MHIPVSNTAGIEVLAFDDALAEALQLQEGYDVNRWLYVPCRYDEYRYILGTRGKNPMICIGINPSTAAPDDLDPTLKSAQRISLYNGYDSFLMFNVYAQRATNPDDMEREYNDWMQSENLKAFEYLLKISPNPPSVWAAWGAIIEKRDYLPKCVSELVKIGNKYGARWYHAGAISKKGHPHHPLYLKSDTLFEPFDVNAYLSDCTCFRK